METKFNSQICTTREQSERLLALGLKKETADMVLVPSSRHDGSDVIRVRKSYLMEEDAISAWSLHRLMEMIGDPFEMQHWLGFDIEKDYNNIVECIEWLIEDNRFNNEYLVNQEAIEEHCKGVLKYLD